MLHCVLMYCTDWWALEEAENEMKWTNSTPLSTATPTSSLTFLFSPWFLTLTEDVFLLFCCVSLWSLAWGMCADCLVSKEASKGPRNWVISAGREKSVRKGMGWLLATSRRSSRRRRYRVDRLTRIPRQITLREHKGRSIYTAATKHNKNQPSHFKCRFEFGIFFAFLSRFRCDSDEDHSPETTEHAGYHHVQDNKLLPVNLLLGESETNIS